MVTKTSITSGLTITNKAITADNNPGIFAVSNGTLMLVIVFSPSATSC